MNEDEIADKVYEERERIVDLYRNGPGDGTIIDPVDDPTINDYFKLDRFGFIVGYVPTALPSILP